MVPLLRRDNTKAKLLTTKPTNWLPSEPTAGMRLLMPCLKKTTIHMTKIPIRVTAETSWTKIFWPRRKTDKGRTSTTEIYPFRQKIDSLRVVYQISKGHKDIRCKRWPGSGAHRRFWSSLVQNPRGCTTDPTLGETHSTGLIEQLNQERIHALHESTKNKRVCDLSGNDNARNIDAL